jgi:hypothetical protein
VALIQKIERLFVAALFGSIMFVTRFFVPFPIDKILIIVDAVLLALAALFIRKVGATSVAAVGGLLTSLWSPALLPFSLIFIVLYGLMVDFFFLTLRIDATAEGVNQKRLIVAMACSTVIIAGLSYYVFSYFPSTFRSYIMAFPFAFIPRNDALNMLVVFMGIVTGAVAGYAASYLWNKYLKNIST